MKKILLFILLISALNAGIPFACAAADGAFQTSTTSVTNHKHTVRRRTSSRRTQRAKMQQRQAEQHLKDEKKVQQVQREAKKDSAGRHK